MDLNQCLLDCMLENFICLNEYKLLKHCPLQNNLWEGETIKCVFKFYSCIGHLIHRFGITENDWHRIKQNIDSKCRTAWRRRQRGMPLTVKAFRGKSPSAYVNIGHIDLNTTSDEDSISQDGELHIHQVSIMSEWTCLTRDKGDF